VHAPGWAPNGRARPQCLRVARERLEGRAHVLEELRVRLRDRRDLSGEAAQLDEQPVEPHGRVRERAEDRFGVGQEGDEVVDDLVDRDAAPGKRGTEALERGALVVARLLVERAEEILELDRLGRVLERDRVAGRVALGLGAERELDVLEAERRARPDLHERVDGQRLDVLVELHVDHRDRVARLLVDPRPDLLDEPDAAAADLHVVAVHEVRAARELGRHVVRRHERKTLVCVVGQEDRNDRDQHRDGPDEDGAGDYR
jgi:hypothetical protein